MQPERIIGRQADHQEGYERSRRLVAVTVEEVAAVTVVLLVVAGLATAVAVVCETLVERRRLNWDACLN